MPSKKTVKRMMKRKTKLKNRKQKILEKTKGLTCHICDFILTGMALTGEIIFSFGQPPGKVIHRMDLVAGGNNPDLLRNQFYRMRRLGWLSHQGEITEKGWERVKNLLPQYQKKRQKWDGFWYLVSFDIPEFRKKDRDILRNKLHRAGFGQLHASLYISPFNYLSVIEKLIDYFGLKEYVIPSMTDKIGREDSRALANRVWKLDELNNLYRDFINKNNKRKKIDKFGLKIEYLYILNQDPQLPRELLPVNWSGDKAFKIYSKTLPKSTRLKMLIK